MNFHSSRLPMIPEHQRPAIDWSGFLPWIELQPPERTFDYMDNQNCAISQWLRSIDYPHQSVFGTTVRLSRGSSLSSIYASILSAIAETLSACCRQCDSNRVPFGVLAAALRRLSPEELRA